MFYLRKSLFPIRNLTRTHGLVCLSLKTKRVYLIKVFKTVSLLTDNFAIGIAKFLEPGKSCAIENSLIYRSLWMDGRKRTSLI